MGEKKRGTAALLLAQPNCTYCGGANPSTSRDHCPPTAIFDNAHRPGGLVFGACAECHEGTRAMDAIVAMLSRNFPSPTSEAGRLEGQKHVRSFVRRYPDLAGLLSFDDREVVYQGQPAHAVSIPKGSRLSRAMEAFGARVALALYRSHFGQPAPLTAAIHSSWHPNAHLDDDEAIEALLKTMGPVRTIGNGKWHVADQFRYWAAEPTDDPGVFCCFAAFRQSFGILAVINPTGPRWGEEDEPFRPGFLQGFRV